MYHQKNSSSEKKYVVLVGFYRVYQIFSKTMLGTKTKFIGPLVLHWDLRKLLVPHSLHEVLANDWVSTHVSTKNMQKLQSLCLRKHSRFMGQPVQSRVNLSIPGALRVSDKKNVPACFSHHYIFGAWCSHRMNFTSVKCNMCFSCFSWKFLIHPCIHSNKQSWAFRDEESTQYSMVPSEIGSWVTFLSLADARLGSIPPPDKQAQLETRLATYLDLFRMLTCTAQPDSKRGIRRTGDSPGSTG